VALPALAGLFYENGSSVMTDILLLGLGCLFLYWSVKWPWQWYHAVQARIVLDHDAGYDEDYAIAEESGEEEESKGVASATDEDNNESNAPTVSQRDTKRQDAASRELRKQELLAFATCFSSPAGVAYLLHGIRPLLSRPSGGLVSNSNLTLFVLAAEVRPFFHLCKMIEARALHLQRIVTTSSVEKEVISKDAIESLLMRVQTLESRPLEKTPQKEEVNGKQDHRSNEVDAAAAIKQELQGQVDALNRAVRRYEKRATIQAADTEKRLHGFERRLNDALSLAAAASRLSQQQPGSISYIFGLLSAAIRSVLASITSLIFLPFRLASDFYRFLFGPRRKTALRSKAPESVSRNKSKGAQF
jgi:hypothetical protein